MSLTFCHQINAVIKTCAKKTRQKSTFEMIEGQIKCVMFSKSTSEVSQTILMLELNNETELFEARFRQN